MTGRLPFLALSCTVALLLVFGSAPGFADREQLVDRIVAVVNEESVLLSDMERLIGLGLAERAPEESEQAFRRRVLDELIERRLRLQEVERFGLAQVPVARIDAGVEAIRGEFPDDAAFHRRLRALGLDMEALRHLVAQQLAVLTFVEERLGPRVFVGLEEIRAFYEERLVPELEQAGAPVPPLDEVREEIRMVLREELLNQEIERWSHELRGRADVLDYLDSELIPLPPVVDSYSVDG